MTNLDCNKENASLIQYISCVDNAKSVTTSNHPPQPQPVDWVDTVVNCATIMNKIFTRNTCRLCHIYSDKQVEFEERIQQNATISATAAEWYNLQQQGAILYNNNNDDGNLDQDDAMYQHHQQQQLDFNASSATGVMSPPPAVTSTLPPPVDPATVELYRKYLFDEESVVDSIEMRIGRSTDDDDDDDKVAVDDEMKDVQLTWKILLRSDYDCYHRKYLWWGREAAFLRNLELGMALIFHNKLCIHLNVGGIEQRPQCQTYWN